MNIQQSRFWALLLMGHLIGLSTTLFSAEDSFSCAVLPALSQHRLLPDEKPVDGKMTNELSVILAPNEIGHASFMLLPARAAQGVTIAVSDLQGEKGTVPASAVDLRIVKYWYQDGNAWDSYFADPHGRELVPELLVHDENLIKVDAAKKENLLRVGETYVRVDDPKYTKEKPFSHITEPVNDTERLAPFTLTANENKRFFLTVRLPKGSAAGHYAGTLKIQEGANVLGTLNLKVRVLPFELPEPMTWYDPTKKFLAAIRMPLLSADFKLANKDIDVLARYRKMLYKSMIEHNMVYPLVFSKHAWGLDKKTDEILFRENLKWMKEAGFPTDMMIGGVAGFSWNLIFQKPEKRPAGVEERFFKGIDNDLKTIREIMGNDIVVYPEGWNEPSMKVLKAQRSTWKQIHARGLKIQQSGKAKHLTYGGYNEDIINCAARQTPESVRAWHAIGTRVTNYAWPHVGPENPDMIRHTHGMDIYKNDLDGTSNYHILSGGRGNIWRDGYKGSQFRTFAFVYPVYNAILDTLAYEGFRAGIDDVRYATKLRQLADEAVLSKDVEVYYAGKKALRYLALAPAERMNLDTLRLEMIDQILKLRDLLASTSSK